MTGDNTALQIVIYLFILFIQYAIIVCIVRACARSIVREEIQKLNIPDYRTNLAYT